MTVNGYVTQSNTDATPILLERNRSNAEKLRRSMADMTRPIAASYDPTIWAIPSYSGNTQYVTALNWGYLDGRNASVVMKPQIGNLSWDTKRPIYDMRAKRRVTTAEASTVDLTRDGFAMYALQPDEISSPGVTIRLDTDGFYYARPGMISGSRQLTGIPVQLTIAGHGESVTLYSATGLATRLPVRAGDPSTSYTVVCEELLSGLSSAASFTPAPAIDDAGLRRTASQARAIQAFAARKDRPLIIALTAKQAANRSMVRLANDLSASFRAARRTVRIGRAAPDDLVQSLQAVKPITHFPQWQTLPADIILLGSISDNLLIYDQYRGDLLPSGADAVKGGKSLIAVTYSPFVGEYQSLNLIAPDTNGLRQAVMHVARSLASGKRTK